MLVRMDEQPFDFWFAPKDQTKIEVKNRLALNYVSRRLPCRTGLRLASQNRYFQAVKPGIVLLLMIENRRYARRDLLKKPT